MSDICLLCGRYNSGQVHRCTFYSLTLIVRWGDMIRRGTDTLFDVRGLNTANFLAPELVLNLFVNIPKSTREVIVMQANYPNKLNRTVWDPVHLNYPVRKFPETGKSSEAIGRYWKNPPDVLHEVKTPIEEALDYCRNHNVTSSLTRSQTSADFGYKIPETERINKHTSCCENLYIYPPSRKLADRTPALKAHATSEMKSSYTVPTIAPRLVTDKNQFKHPASIPQLPPAVDPVIEELEPLDTTNEGFEKYLDPYLTTSRLHHRPFTADQLARPSNSKDVVTYYTYANIPRVRSPKPNWEDFRLPLSKAKSVYDREKFKQGFREIRTHNKLNWVPRTFRTEVRDNYVEQTSRPESRLHNFEEEVRSQYQRSIASLQTNIQQEDSATRHFYSTENSQIGSGKPICSVLDQFVEKNKRLDSKR